MKKLIIIPIGALIVLFSACQNNSTEQQKEPATQPAAPPASTAKNPDMTGFAAEVDADKNGQMSKAEWQAKGLPESSFNMFEKGRGYVTLEDYQKNAAPDGIDLNGDGKLTVAEFVAFDKTMSEKIKSGQAPPPPAH